MQKGSLRNIVIMWIRMSLGIGILMISYYTKTFGLIPGIFLITVGVFLNYASYKYIFEAAFYTKKFNYFEIIENLLGKKTLYIFNVTYFLDLSSTVAIYAIITWKLFIHILMFFSIVSDNWLLVPETLELNEENSEQKSK